MSNESRGAPGTCTLEIILSSAAPTWPVRTQENRLPSSASDFSLYDIISILFVLLPLFVSGLTADVFCTSGASRRHRKNPLPSRVACKVFVNLRFHLPAGLFFKMSVPSETPRQWLSKH